ncbi:MAG: hypothetical protein A3F46_10550 [Legionellales bacterium RIFCSPHIGHO2_12_FULL_42_9]|nr:MAG: hypothetical protein A3F46_10550 [Legionellales bacterium RIFCSPHIGHO2_12_FULL_42_9]
MIKGYATPAPQNQTQQEQARLLIVKLYSDLARTSKLTMAERLDTISAQFVGLPYQLGALGEGPNARYDQSPLYRIDSFDCETFVDTVLAIALSNNWEGFKQCIRKVRYWQGHAQFTARNHFTDLDWNKNNQQQGYLSDITLNFKDSTNQAVALIATATIDKPSWYGHLTSANIKLRHPNAFEQKKRLLELQQQGSQLPISKSSIAYIPLTALFFRNGQPNNALFAQIPNAAIIEIIRPNWDLQSQIGTCLNVSHLGFVFWKNGKLIFRQASTVYHKVVDVSLIDYLHEALSSPTIKGINVQKVLIHPLCHPRSAGLD